MIGRITADPFVEQVKNGEAKALFAQVELSTGEIRTVQLFPGSGDETWPCKGDVVVVERKGGFLFASCTWDKSEPKCKTGEREIYSRKTDSEKAASVFLDGDGNINLNGDSKRLVTYAELNQELQRIWAMVKSHTHEVPGISTGVSTGAATPSANLAPVLLDISAAETQTIKTGG